MCGAIAGLSLGLLFVVLIYEAIEKKTYLSFLLSRFKE